MKKIKYLVLILLIGCIGEDIEFDEVAPVIRFTNPISSLEVDTNYQFEYVFLNNVGMEVEPSNIIWTSSDEAFLTIDNDGLAQAISKGKVSVNIQAMLDDLVADTSISFDITGDSTVVVQKERSGTVQTTSNYSLAGDFILSEEEDNSIKLSFDSGYIADDGLPGLFVYLSNNPNSSFGALEIGAVTTFYGAHDYLVNDVGLFDYKYVLYFCKPFNAKVGHGEIQ